MSDFEGDKETQRTEAFSDGVFAIAITLLVLELKVPHDLHGDALLHALGAQWVTYFAFFVSFATIGVMWVNHHRLFNLIRRSDNAMLMFNLLLLLVVTVVPFPTSLLGEYLASEDPSDARLASVLYNLSGLSIAVCFNLLWRYAAKGGRLMGPDVDLEAVERITKQFRWGPVMYVLSSTVAFFMPRTALLIDLSMVTFFALPPPPLKKALSLKP